MKLTERPHETIGARVGGHLRGRWLPWLSRVLLSVMLLAFLLRSVEPTVFWKAIRSIDSWLLSASIATFFASQLWAAYRWHFLLRRLGHRLSLHAAVRYTMLGQFSALFLPGQISGDIVRAVAVAHGKREKASFALSVLVDKLALLGPMVFVVLLGGLGSRQWSDSTALHLTALALLVLSSLALVFLCRYREDDVPTWLVSISQRVPFTRRYLLSLVGWLRAPHLPYPTILLLLAMGFVLQLFNVVGGYIMARSFEIEIGFVDWALISTTASIVQALPLTIGGLGLRDGVLAAMLAAHEIPLARSAAFSLSRFVLVTLLTAVLWFFFDGPYVRKLDAMRGATNSGPGSSLWDLSAPEANGSQLTGPPLEE